MSTSSWARFKINFCVSPSSLRDLREDLSRHGYLLPGPKDNFLHRLSVRRGVFIYSVSFYFLIGIPGGFYIDRGCAKLITSGKVLLISLSSPMHATY
jgi:hypothetical protein